MERVHRELGDELDVLVQAAEVGRERDLETGGGLGERGVGRLVLRAEGRGRVQDERRLVDLHLGGTGGLKLGEELSKDGHELVEDVDWLERGRLLVAAGLAEDQVGDRAEKDGARDDAGGLGLDELVNGLGVDELELGVRRDLSLDVVVCIAGTQVSVALVCARTMWAGSQFESNHFCIS